MIVSLTEEYMVENHAIEVLKNLSYQYDHGSNLTPDEKERESYRDVILKKRFISAIKRINPWLSDELAEKVYQIVSNIDHPDPIMRGKFFYDMLTTGVKLTFREGGEEKIKLVWLVDFSNPDNNEFLASNQFEVEYYYESGRFRRPDLVIFLNGIPIAVFEFKGFNSGDTAKDAFYDHKAKIKDIPQLYQYAQILVISDGLETKYGSPTSDWERFFVWEGIESDLTNGFIDLEFEEISERVALDPEEKEDVKRAFAKLERIMLTDEYLEKVAKDIVEHFNKRIKEFDGKAMVVTISRKVAVELYKRIIKQPNAPSVAVVMSLATNPKTQKNFTSI